MVYLPEEVCVIYSGSQSERAIDRMRFIRTDTFQFASCYCFPPSHSHAMACLAMMGWVNLRKCTVLLRANAASRQICYTAFREGETTDRATTIRFCTVHWILSSKVQRVWEDCPVFTVVRICEALLMKRMSG